MSAALVVLTVALLLAVHALRHDDGVLDREVHASS
jgi:hypothetical protein